MIPVVIKKTFGSVCVNISQACLVALFVTDNNNKEIILGAAVVTIILGLYLIYSADRGEKILARLRGTKRTFRFPRNTTFAVEEIR